MTTKKEPSDFERFEDFTRRLLRVPKSEIDRRLAEQKRARQATRAAKPTKRAAR